jgi:hypothetical protein
MLTTRAIEIKHLPDAFGSKDAEPTDAQRKALDYLAVGDYKQAQLEMLTNKRSKIKIFSIAYSYEGRLLLVRHHGSWLVLEDVPKHRYDMARFLNPKVLARFLKRKDEINEFDDLPLDVVEFAPLSAGELADLPPAPSTTEHASADVTFKPVVYLNNQFVSLSDVQKQLLTHLQNENAKALLYGPAGAGKTSLLWQVLVDGLQQNVSHFVCLTQNPLLINTWRDQADSSPVLSAREEGDCDWLFATPVNWLKELCPELANKKEVGEEECTDWIKHYLRAHKNDNIPETITQRVLEIYTEFRNLSGYVDDQASYLQLNELNCLFHERNEKLFLLKLYAAYLTEIKRQQDTFDPNFHRIKNIEQVADIFQGETTYLVDEGQELSTLLAQQIIRIAKGRVIISYDDHQRRSDSNSKRFFYQRQMGEGVELFGLPVSFRCRPHVTAFLNRLIQLKFKLSGGKSDEYEASGIASASEETDTAEIPVETNTANLPALKAKYPRTSTVIITLPVHENEAREKFKGYEVYTYKNLAGLEFNNTILFKCFGLPIMREINKILAGLSPTARVNSANLAKHFDPTFILVLNGLFVAASRSLGDIAIVEKELGPIRHLIVELLPHVALLLERKHGNELTSPLLVEEKIDYQLLLERAKQLLYQGDPGGQVAGIRRQLPASEQLELSHYQARLEKTRSAQQAAAEKAKEMRAARRDAPTAEGVLREADPGHEKRVQAMDQKSSSPIAALGRALTTANLRFALEQYGINVLVERRDYGWPLIDLLQTPKQAVLLSTPLLFKLFTPDILTGPVIINPGEIETTLFNALLGIEGGRNFLVQLFSHRTDLAGHIRLRDLLRPIYCDAKLLSPSYTIFTLPPEGSLLSKWFYPIVMNNKVVLADVIDILKSTDPEREGEKAIVDEMLEQFNSLESFSVFCEKLLIADASLLSELPFSLEMIEHFVDGLLNSGDLTALLTVLQTQHRARDYFANEDVLCAKFPIKKITTCRFQFLQMSPGGKRIIEELMRHNPTLTFDRVQERMQLEGFPFIVYPSLYTPDEFDRIERLWASIIKRNDAAMHEFFSSSEAEDLLFRVSVTGKVLFYTLSKSPVFIDFLLQNPDYWSKLPLKKMATCFDRLLLTKPGALLLVRLGDYWNLSDQLREAPFDTLTEPMGELEEVRDPISPLSFMLIAKEFHRLLLMISHANIRFNIDLVNKIKKEIEEKKESLIIIEMSCYYPDLIAAVFFQRNQFAGSPPITLFDLFALCPQQRLLFHWMSKSSRSHQFLDEMTNNPNLLKLLLPISQLAIEMTRPLNNEAGTNPLIWLAQTNHGRAALLKLFHADTASIKFLASEKILTKRLEAPENPFDNKTVLDILATSDRTGYLCVFHFMWANAKTLMYLSKSALTHFTEHALLVCKDGETLTEIEQDIFTSFLATNRVTTAAAIEHFGQRLFSSSRAPRNNGNEQSEQNKNQGKKFKKKK